MPSAHQPMYYEAERHSEPMYYEAERHSEPMYYEAERHSEPIHPRRDTAAPMYYEAAQQNDSERWLGLFTEPGAVLQALRREG